MHIYHLFAAAAVIAAPWFGGQWIASGAYHYVRDDSAASSRPPITTPAPKPSKLTSKQKPKTPEQELAGNWYGKGAGEEVRFRHPNNLLILTVKHDTEFLFHIDDALNIAGEGIIIYNLERDTTGLDSLVESVKGGLSVMQPPGAPAMLNLSVEKLTENVGEFATSTAAGSKLQYEAPHLKFGKEQRRYNLRGKVRRLAGTGDRWEMVLEMVGQYMQGATASPELIAEWSTGGRREQKNFPCWSPFLTAAATLRRGPGGIWIAEFEEKGNHRNGVSVWQEYGYTWMARQNR